MVAEVATFLVTEKLQTILTHEKFVVLGLRRKLERVLEKIQQLSVFLEDCDLFHGNNDDVFKVVIAIYMVEAAVDLYLRKRVGIKGKVFLKMSSSFQYLMLRSLWSQMELGNGINKFMNNVQEIIFNSKTTRTTHDSDLIQYSAQIDLWENIHQHLDTESSMTIDQTKHVSNLVSKLTMKQECDLHVLSMVDSGGSGKTEVVRHVYNTAAVKNHFDLQAWVWLSKDSTCRDILVGLILQATMTRSIDLDHKKDEELGEMLFKLLMGRRYLIVLDNYTASDSWHALTIALPDFRNGSRVVITARCTEILEPVDPWNPRLELYPLTMEESWKLLLKQVNKSIHDGVEKRDEETVSRLKKQVLSKSRGSAVAIGLLGGILYNEESSGWKQVLDKIPNSVESQSTSFNILSLSFRTLPPMLKSCFVYLVVFPKSFEIPVRRLLRLWIAEGFLDVKSLPAGSSMVLEDLADLCLKILINRKLVEVTRWKRNGRPKTCRMPSIVHEFFHPQSIQMRFFSVYPESLQHQVPVDSIMQFSSSQRLAHYSSFKDNSKSGSRSDYLSSFLSFDTSVRGTPNIEIGNFFKNLIDKKCFALLKLLDLEGVYKPILPDAMGKMLLLKFLGLRSTVLDSIPSWIGNLPLLETLDLKHTNVTILPKSIWKSKTLRHLHVEDVRLDGSCKKITGNALSNLQVFVGFLIVNEKAVRNILRRLLNLKEVGITCQKDSMYAVTEWISQQTKIESLKLISVDKFGKPSSLSLESLSDHHRLYNLYLLGSLSNPLANFLPQCIRKLTLSKSELKDDPMEVLGDLPELTVLRLYANSYVGRGMTSSNGKFLKLRSLKLWVLKRLRKWTIEEGAMPCLEELELRRCEELSEVSGLQYLTSLKELHLTNMNTNFVKKMKKRRAERILHVCVSNWKFGYNQVSIDMNFG